MPDRENPRIMEWDAEGDEITSAYFELAMTPPQILTHPETEADTSADTLNNSPAQDITTASDEHQEVNIFSLINIEDLQTVIEKRDRKILRLQKKLEHRSSWFTTRTHTHWVEDKTTVSLLKEEIEDLKSSLHRQNREWYDHCQTLQRQIEESTWELENVNNHYDKVALKAQQAEEKLAGKELNYNTLVNRLQRNIDDLTAQNKTLISKLETANTSKGRPQRSADPSKVTDDAIVRIWDKMRYGINKLANHVLTRCPPENSLMNRMSDVSCVLSHMTNRDIAALKDEDYRSCVVEKYIWHAIISSSLQQNNDGDFTRAWAGTVGQSFSLVVDEMLEIVEKKAMDLTNLFQWKATGGKMIEEMWGTDHGEFRKYVKEMTEVFAEFLPRDSKSQVKKQDKLSEGLCKVLEYALELQVIFMSSKAHFYIDWPSIQSSGQDISYDADSMDAEGYETPLDERSIVLFQLSPSLMKVGTADGDSYDQSMRLIKARVICN
ncbi:hypothetical protein K4K59_000744 [Colletotrichum sp. SAR11_240]|nr:hypothetical protein K4K59_000744 [Colletotrichum sp. SAR11_240]